MTDEVNRKAVLVSAFKSGVFLDAVYKCYLAEPDEREDLPLEIVNLHNDGHINVLAEFENLNKEQGSGPGFFMTRSVFEKALPNIKAPIRDVMRCVLQLHKAAGQDMAAGTIFSAYISHCEKDPARPLEAMKLIEKEHDQFADILPATVEAGSRKDNPYFLAEVLRLSQHPEVYLRRRAVFSLSRIEWPNGTRVPDEALSGLKKAVIEDDDELLASVIKSAFKLYLQDKTTEASAIELIDSALSKGDDFALHAGATIFGFETKEIPASLVDVILGNLKRVKPTNKGTLDNIDYGIAALLKDDRAEKAIRFLEEYLLLHAGTLTIKAFDSASSEILTNKTLLSKVTTRWFLNGARVLCESVHDIGGRLHDGDLQIDVDAAELMTKDLTHMVFVARKAIGYFFIKPVTAASILISLMRMAPDDETLEHLGQLLFDPLLVNYTGSAREYVEAQTQQETGKVKETLVKALAAIEAYLETLRGVPDLAALHPSQAHREAYRRHMSESTAASMKEAEKYSVFLHLVSRSTLLYGRKSISYVHAGDGPPRRMEIPLTSHSVQMEVPRMDNLDQHGLNYMLRVFRAERFRA
ncbi:MAG: hypothetical protein IT364_18550 [Candidatus Hydrogenedentes bacterium]|nr:hypothetical protein [Candidatus Hydrogenedentota bacterium]